MFFRVSPLNSSCKSSQSLKTGITIENSESRSQLENKAKSIQLLKSQLHDLELRKNQDEKDKLDIASLEINSIIKMKEYFSSFGVELIFNMYNQKNYVMKPYIYDKPELYNKSKSVDEFYYEIPVTLDKELFIYRIGFRL